MSGPPPSLAALIAAQLRLADGYLRDARILAQIGSRNAAILIFQALEAALIAVLSSQGTHVPRGIQHQLAAMADLLPDANPLKRRFQTPEHLTGYTKTYRSASPSGRVRPSPSAKMIAQWLAAGAKIVEDLRERLCRRSASA